MRHSEPIRFLIRIACFAPFVGALLVFNWVCGQRPVRRFFTVPLDAAAEALVAGKTIWCHADMVDLKPVWLEHVQVRPDVVVLGSSRVAQIPQDWFRPRGMLNLAMLVGDFADAVAILQECLDAGKAPKLVLLDLNPTLTYQGRSHIAPALAPHFRSALLHYGILPPIFFSGPLTLDALRWDPRTFLDEQVWEASEAIVPGSYRMRPDGSADWPETEARKTPDDVDREVISAMHGLDPMRKHWRTVSQPERFYRKILGAFLDDMRARGIRVVVVEVPVHPKAYEFYTSQGGYDDSWIRSDMAARGVSVIGSFSPSKAQVTREDFFDDVHVHAPVLHRLLREGGIVE